MDWHIVAGVAKLPFLPHRGGAAPLAAHAPEPNVPGTGAASDAPQPAQPLDALLIDNAGSLDRFYAALARLDAHAADAGAVIVHFGDSPTTADLITGDVRQQLQQRFGDAGPGFNLIAKPWAWYQHRDIDETDHGWKWTTAVGFMREGQYGIGGAAFEGGPGAFTRYKFSGPGPTTAELVWSRRPDGGSVTLSADDTELATIDTSGSPANATTASQTEFQMVKLPASVHTFEVHAVKGNVRLYGILFGRAQPGVVYDSIGLNGASITVLSRAMPKDMMRESFVHLHPDLIIVNYGTNEAGFAAFIDKQYEGELRTAVARVRESAPTASILLMSPMDRGERGGGNFIATMATIPKIVAIQRRVAADTGCAFFNTFEAMGGDGTMQRWYEGRPRLVGGDLIHPTPQGAKIVATAFVDQLEAGYARYKARTAPAPRSAP
jgi:lysophospholipase L1-like esterase